MSLPGWHSIGATTAVSDFFALSGFALFLIAIIFEILALFYARRRDWLIEEAAHSTDFERQQQHDAQIAALRRRLSDIDKNTAKSESKKARRRPSRDLV
jgi:hypothetical protein